VFARILGEFFRRFDLPKLSVFSGQTIQNFKTLLDPPPPRTVTIPKLIDVAFIT